MAGFPFYCQIANSRPNSTIRNLVHIVEILVKNPHIVHDFVLKTCVLHLHFNKKLL